MDRGPRKVWTMGSGMPTRLGGRWIRMGGWILSMVVALQGTGPGGLSGQASDVVDALASGENPLPEVIAHFMSGAAERGLHPDAPPNTRQFGRMVGVWACIESTLDPRTGEVVAEAPALWAWRYVADGFGVEDFWYQSEDWYGFSRVLGRGLSLRQLRVFDLARDRWRVAMINSTGGETPGQVFRTFSAREEAGEIIMTFDEPPESPERRLVFSDVTEDRFSWRAEVRPEGVDGWFVTSRIEARKVRSW